MQHTDSPKDPVNQLAPKEPGAPAADDHDRAGPPSPETIARGYELDTYDAKSVISVPLLVILFFVLAFGTVTIIFNQIAYPKKRDPNVHPAAAERNKRSLNERMAGIGNDGQGGKSTRDQPRLEVLRQRDPGTGPHDLSRAITRPELPEGNSPELHPEDLRATKDKYPELYRTGGGKVGLDKTMGLNDDALKTLFPVQKAGSKLIGSRHVPTAANAGRGAEESLVEIPKPPEPKAEEKRPDPKPDGKKPGDKKPEDKKPEPPKKPDDKKADPPKQPDPPKKEDKKP